MGNVLRHGSPTVCLIRAPGSVLPPAQRGADLRLVLPKAVDRRRLPGLRGDDGRPRAGSELRDV